ncbi:deoxynucleoside kinase [Paenibacillus rhizoplanae]
MKHAPFIAVEGPIGAGKTTLATMLATELQLPVIKEIVDEKSVSGQVLSEYGRLELPAGDVLSLQPVQAA